MIMKKTHLIWLSFVIFIVTLSGCASSSTNKADTSSVVNKPDTSEYVLIEYPLSSYLAWIKDKQEITKLTDLFNNTEYLKTDIEPDREGLWMEVMFHKNNAATTFYIYKNDVIKKGDGSLVKSKDISFKKIYKMFEEYHMMKK